jgi:hypothetical protein
LKKVLPKSVVAIAVFKLGLFINLVPIASKLMQNMLLIYLDRCQYIEMIALSRKAKKYN